MLCNLGCCGKLQHCSPAAASKLHTLAASVQGKHAAATHVLLGTLLQAAGTPLIAASVSSLSGSFYLIMLTEYTACMSTVACSKQRSLRIANSMRVKESFDATCTAAMLGQAPFTVWSCQVLAVVDVDTVMVWPVVVIRLTCLFHSCRERE